MPLTVPAELEAEMDELISHYPQKRSASLMLLHALQEHFGFISSEAMEWVAAKLELQPINIYELVTFYPMFRQASVGKFHLKVCRTLSCALAGSNRLYEHFCTRLNLDPHEHGPQTSADGRFTVEFVECLASCGTAPVLMLNDRLEENVTTEQANALLAGCK